ncbi:MAG: hypothetical protein HY362_03705 [Candidatus Aenigmarchaeota archaeon]|nr:hypothetical protein [Candidatus Aenigmarchaeota archaeon]
MKQKGIGLFSATFLFLVMIIFGTAIVTAVFYAVLLDIQLVRISVTVNVLQEPVKTDAALLSFLEVKTPEGIQMKELVVAAASQGRGKDILVRGKVLNPKTEMEEDLKELTGSSSFLLRTTEPEVIIAGDSDLLTRRINSASVPVVLADGSVTKLELLTG